MNVYRLASQKMAISMSLAATMDTRTMSSQRRATAICYSGENSFGHLIKSHTTFYNKASYCRLLKKFLIASKISAHAISFILLKVSIQ